MKKQVLSGFAVLVLAAVAVFNVNMSSKNDISLLSLANIEALANNENNSEKYYTRISADCTITVTGKANSTITVAGIGTVKLDGNGEYTYVRKNGEVRCIKDGSEMCIPQNC